MLIPVRSAITLLRSGAAALVLLPLALTSTAAAQTQPDFYDAVARAFDHLKRETGDALGYQQVVHRPDDPDGTSTSAMREWKSVQGHVPSDMAALVGRCLPPVLEARALLVEGGKILDRRGPSSDVQIVNAKTAQATELLHSVDDCWSEMARLATARRRARASGRRPFPETTPCMQSSRPRFQPFVFASIAAAATVPFERIVGTEPDCGPAARAPVVLQGSLSANSLPCQWDIWSHRIADAVYAKWQQLGAGDVPLAASFRYEVLPPGLWTRNGRKFTTHAYSIHITQWRARAVPFGRYAYNGAIADSATIAALQRRFKELARNAVEALNAAEEQDVLTFPSAYHGPPVAFGKEATFSNGGGSPIRYGPDPCDRFLDNGGMPR